MRCWFCHLAVAQISLVMAYQGQFGVKRTDEDGGSALILIDPVRRRFDHFSIFR